MILIISMDRDHTTDEVIDYLSELNVPYKRINPVDIISKKTNIEVDIKNFNTVLNNYKLDKYKYGWVRKLGMYEELDLFKKHFYKENYQINKHLQNEILNFREHLLQYSSKWLCHPKSGQISKTDVLQKAFKLGINIPDTYIINKKSSLRRLFEKYNGNIIVKSLRDMPFIKKEEKTFFPNTYKVKADDFDKIPETFLPSLVQEEIQKEYELRIFFLDQDFFSAAIFSQLDPLTKIDFRNYNYKKPNRVVPYTLTKELRLQLIKLNTLLKLNTGSIDVIKSNNGKFYFLEINPVGQFGMISKPCNYYLEKTVANYLKKKHNV